MIFDQPKSSASTSSFPSPFCSESTVVFGPTSTFEAVIASSFGDIFRNNCTKQGLVPVQVTPEVDRAILDAVSADPSLLVSVDVERGTVECGDIHASFTLDEFTRQRLLHGWDDIGLTLRYEDHIAAFESRRASWLPSSATPPSPSAAPGSPR